MAVLSFLIVIHEIAHLISMLYRRTEEIQQFDLDFGKCATECWDDPKQVVSANFITETQSNISFTEVCSYY
jgi:hypothetical protein